MKAFLFAAAVMTAALTCGAKELKVLMIGNSFSQSVLTYLPEIAASAPDCKLKLGQAMIGGCTFEHHCKVFRQAERDPAFVPTGPISGLIRNSRGTIRRTSRNC